jgi:hypothetical protein
MTGEAVSRYVSGAPCEAQSAVRNALRTNRLSGARRFMKPEFDL